MLSVQNFLCRFRSRHLEHGSSSLCFIMWLFAFWWQQFRKFIQKDTCKFFNHHLYIIAQVNKLLFQSGKYEEPYWLSNESKALIKSMLQTDPVKRITIHELCHHPWITSNSLKPIVFIHRTKVRTFLEKKNWFYKYKEIYE